MMEARQRRSSMLVESHKICLSFCCAVYESMEYHSQEWHVVNILAAVQGTQDIIVRFAALSFGRRNQSPYKIPSTCP